ncbi:putative endoribonuclease MazF [Azospirillaceae bacterium]
MKRGELVTVSLQGDYGKPRPSLVIQSDLFNDHPSVTLLPITGALLDTPLFRLPIDPTPNNQLRKRSQVMVDKIQTVPREKVGSVFGQVDDETMVKVTRALLLWIGIA